MRAELWVPGPLPGQNEVIKAAKGAGGTGRGYSRLKKQWTEDVAMRALAAKLPRFQQATIEFFWVERDRRRDPDNFASAKKFILDGLVLSKVLPGDGWGVVKAFQDGWKLADPLGDAGVLVTLEGE